MPNILHMMEKLISQHVFSVSVDAGGSINEKDCFLKLVSWGGCPYFNTPPCVPGSEINHAPSILFRPGFGQVWGWQQLKAQTCEELVVTKQV